MRIDKVCYDKLLCNHCQIIIVSDTSQSIINYFYLKKEKNHPKEL